MQLFALYLLCFVSLVLLPCKANPVHVDTALRYVGTVEKAGNRGAIIDKWNTQVGAPLGSAYCASFVSYCLRASNNKQVTIRSPRARAFATRDAISSRDILRGQYAVKMGDIVVWTRAGGGHVGIAASDWHGVQGAVIEANTTPDGRSGSEWNGGGVWIKKHRRITLTGAFKITHVLPVN